MDFITHLQQVLKEHSNLENKPLMEAYLKNKFVMFGIKSPNRKALLKDVLNQHKDEVLQNCRNIVKKLYKLPEREFHYCAMELMNKFFKKKYTSEDIKLIEQLITTYSHWDSVDFIAKHILGNYLLIHHGNTKEIINNFSNSNNMWLNRSVILFQLGYKDKTNSDILFRECLKHSKSNEFFIQKAIGWALREYAKTNSEAVKYFVEINKLSSLSSREALKHFN